jgi:hypothetical protein
MKTNSNESNAMYFGLEVEVICRLENCSLIRFGTREFVVDSQDLCEHRQALRQAA